MNYRDIIKSAIIFLLLGNGFILNCQKTDTINLQGVWKFQIDSVNLGIEEKWFNKMLDDEIILPGSMSENNKGYTPSVETKWTGSIYDSSWYFNPKMEKYRQPGNTKFPFWLTPDKYYVGVAWYQKEIEFPKNWKNKRIVLLLERPHWQSTVWIDDKLIGFQNSLSTPHIFEFSTENLNPGIHRLTIRIDNGIRDVDPGINSHSITDHTQGNWNGIAGSMEMFPGADIYLDSIRIYPGVKEKRVLVKLNIKGYKAVQKGKITVSVKSLNSNKEHFQIVGRDITSSDSALQLVFPMGENFKTWDEFDPNLYEMSIVLQTDKKDIDERRVLFGMRDFSINNTRFYVNGNQIFLRGTVENCVFPKTGYPPCNEEEWTRVFEICKSFGLNHMRFHSNCPPEAAFIAADKAGIYLQVEGPSWAKYSTSLGYGKPIDKYLYDETERILLAYGNHPSFCMMAYGNEPSGRYVEYLEKWLDYFKQKDPGRAYCGASIGRSWTIIPNSDYIVRSSPRGLEWNNRQPESVFDYRNRLEDQQRPYVSHEMGQWCAFPDFTEIVKYTGPLKAKNFELFREELENNHMGDLAHDFLMASGKLQASCYKQEIEAALRTPDLAGFQLLGLNDFPGQGTALVGVLNAFWEEKGYITANEFNNFCNVVTPLVRLPRFTYLNTDTLIFSIEVANFSKSQLSNAVVNWQLRNENGDIIKSGKLPNQNIQTGNFALPGTIDIPLNNANEASKLVLEVTVNQYKNNWNIWVYPQELPTPVTSEVYICDTFDNKARNILRNGGKVLLLAAGQVQNGKDVEQYLTPAFWNTSWFKMRPPHTTGILIHNEHPALKKFPTDYYSDIQWWEVANRQQVMNLENFPADFKSIVQPIDTWFLSRRLSMLFEAKIGNGKLMVCSIDLKNNMENRPVARQLLYSILEYMNSNEFVPGNNIEFDIVQELFEIKQRDLWDSFVKSKNLE
jgi:hypothetical protein